MSDMSECKLLLSMLARCRSTRQVFQDVTIKARLQKVEGCEQGNKNWSTPLISTKLEAMSRATSALLRLLFMATLKAMP